MRSPFAYVLFLAAGSAAWHLFPDQGTAEPIQASTDKSSPTWYPKVPRPRYPTAFRVKLLGRGNCLGCSSGRTTSHGGLEGSQASLTRPASVHPLAPDINIPHRYRAPSQLNPPPERPPRWDEVPRTTKEKFKRAPSLPKSPPPPT